jgi:LysM repeat protein
MKKFSFVLGAMLLIAPLMTRAQDAATEERLNKLNGRIQDMLDANDAQNKRIEELAKSIDSLRQQLDKPQANYASADDLKRLAEKLQEVDRKRQEDNEHILKTIQTELKTLSATAPVKTPGPKPPSTPTDTPAISSKGFEKVVESGDTLSTIIAAYKDKGIKVTLDQILKANPGLKPEKLKVGQKIFIPAPGAE